MLSLYLFGKQYHGCNSLSYIEDMTSKLFYLSSRCHAVTISSSVKVPDSRCRSSSVDVSTGFEHHEVSHSLHFEQLYVSRWSLSAVDINFFDEW